MDEDKEIDKAFLGMILFCCVMLCLLWNNL